MVYNRGARPPRAEMGSRCRSRRGMHDAARDDVLAALPGADGPTTLGGGRRRTPLTAVGTAAIRRARDQCDACPPYASHAPRLPAHQHGAPAPAPPEPSSIGSVASRPATPPCLPAHRALWAFARTPGAAIRAVGCARSASRPPAVPPAPSAPLLAACGCAPPRRAPGAPSVRRARSAGDRRVRYAPDAPASPIGASPRGVWMRATAPCARRAIGTACTECGRSSCPVCSRCSRQPLRLSPTALPPTRSCRGPQRRGLRH